MTILAFSYTHKLNVKVDFIQLIVINIYFLHFAESLNTVKMRKLLQIEVTNIGTNIFMLTIS